MRCSIKSKFTGDMVNFWAPDEGGYVRVESGNRLGSLGEQITRPVKGNYGCESAVSTPGDTARFEAICSEWLNRD